MIKFLEEVKARAYLALGEINIKKKNYDDACMYLDKALKLYKKLMINEKMDYIYYQIGVSNFRMFKFDAAIVYFNSSHYYSLIYDNNEIFKKSLNALSDAYLRMGKYELALKSINECLVSITESDNFYSKALNTKGICYGELKEYDKSNDIYEKLLNIYLTTNPKDLFLGCIYTNLGANYCNLDDYDKSLEYFNKAEDFRNTFDKKRLGKTILEKANVYIKQKLFHRAIECIEESLRYSEQYGNLEYLITGYNLLKEIFIV